EATASVLSAARRAYALTVADLPRRQDAATSVLLDTADAVVIVVPASVRAAAAALATMRTLGRDPGDLRLVVRDSASSRLSASELGSAIGIVPTAAYRSEP